MSKEKSVRGVPYGSGDLPVFGTADVVIAGAGPGGLGAALAAAWSGASVLVIEEYGIPGGMASVGEVNPFMCSHVNGESLDFPVYGQWIETMQRYLPDCIANNITQADVSRRSINKEAAALAAEDMLLAAGVKILYHHSAVGVETDDDGMIKSIICHTRGGFGKVCGKCYVDCTGDANLAAMAGVPFEQGDERGGCQPMTLCFKVSHVNIPFIIDEAGGKYCDPEWKKRLNASYVAAQASGRISSPRHNVLMMPFLIADDNVIHFNTTRVIGYDATCGAELSAAEIEGRKQLRELLEWLRTDIPEFADARLMSMAVQIGVRESRRICGLYKLVVDDFEKCSRFPDAIARCSYYIDQHSPWGAGTHIVRLDPGEFYEIPYRSIVPVNKINLTVGGRPICADVLMHSSLRIMPTAISIGQGAGIAAALAVTKNCTPDKIDGTEVREELKKFGARL